MSDNVPNKKGGEDVAKDSRLYGKFTLDFPEHEKIAVLSDAAFRMLVEMTLWSRKMLTDGRVSKRLAGARWSLEAASELLHNHPENPSLIEDGEYYIIHDFASHQTTKADIEAKKEAGKRGGKRKAANARAGKTSKKLAPASNSLAGARDVLKQNSSNNLAKTETETYNPPTPNGVGPPRGDAQPLALIEEPSTPAKPEPRGTRLSEGWMPTARSVGLVRSEHPHLTSEILEREHRKFCDYWASVPGQRGVKRDWDATWRNWIRRSQEGKSSAQRTDGVPMVGKKIQGYAEAAKIAYQQRMERENNA